MDKLERKTARRRRVPDGAIGILRITSAPHYHEDPWEKNHIGKEFPFTEKAPDKFNEGKFVYTIESHHIGEEVQKFSRWAWVHSDQCKIIMERDDNSSSEKAIDAELGHDKLTNGADYDQSSD